MSNRVVGILCLLASFAVTLIAVDATPAQGPIRRRIAERQIRESEQRLRDIVDTSQDWIWELDSKRQFVFSSESVRGILGSTVAQVLGCQLEVLLHDADREDFASDRFFRGRIGNHDTARGLAFFLCAPDHDAIVQGTKFHS